MSALVRYRLTGDDARASALAVIGEPGVTFSDHSPIVATFED